MQNPLMPKPQPVIPVERVASRIYLIRGEKVMLDSDLAELYGVPTKVLNQAVRRNRDRFPEDFMFPLTSAEVEILRSQIVTLKPTGRGKHSKYLPNVFTEHGVAMLSSVLRSKKAIQVNIAIIRTFVKIRQILASNRDLARKIQEHDRQIAMLFDTVEKLLAPPAVRRAVRNANICDRIGIDPGSTDGRCYRPELIVFHASHRMICPFVIIVLYLYLMLNVANLRSEPFEAILSGRKRTEWRWRRRADGRLDSIEPGEIVMFLEIGTDRAIAATVRAVMRFEYDGGYRYQYAIRICKPRLLRAAGIRKLQGWHRRRTL
jgi:hypothetical protein